MLPASKNSTRSMVSVESGVSTIWSKPGIHAYFCGRGCGITTDTRLPRSRSASANARLQPRVSPSASLWPRIMTWLCLSHSSFSWSISLRRAVMLTRVLLAIAALVSVRLLGVLGRQDLAQGLRDAHRVLDRGIDLEAQVWGELEVLQPATEPVPDQPRGAAQAGQGGAALVLAAQHADANARRPQVGRHAHLGDAHEADPGVLQITPDDLHDLLADLGAHLNGAVAAHQRRAYRRFPVDPRSRSGCTGT